MTGPWAWTTKDLLELNALDPGLVQPSHWVEAISSSLGNDTQPKREFDRNRYVRLRRPRVLINLASREPESSRGSNAPSRARGHVHDGRRGSSAETPSLQEFSEHPPLRRVHHHEGVRRATDSAYFEQWFELSPDVPHPHVPLQLVHTLLRNYLRLNLDETWSRLARALPAPQRMAAVLAAFCEAVQTPCAFVGGNTNKRGFGSPGSEWPQFGALIDGVDYRSDTTLRNWFWTWEAREDATAEVLGYRKPRLVPEALICPVTGRQHDNRFERNHVYLTRETLVRWCGHELLADLVDFIRHELAPRHARTLTFSDLNDNQRQQLWVITKPGRRWRRSAFSYRDGIELTYKQRRAKSDRRRSAIAKKLEREARWRHADRRKRDRLRTEAAKVSDPSSALALQMLPIIPPLSPRGEIRASGGSAAPARKVGPSGPAHCQGPPVGRGGGPGPPGRSDTPQAISEIAKRAAFEGRTADDVPPPAPTVGPRWSPSRRRDDTVAAPPPEVLPEPVRWVPTTDDAAIEGSAPPTSTSSRVPRAALEAAKDWLRQRGIAIPAKGPR